jgi:hypothetical protein
MLWLRGQIAAVMDSVAAAAESWQPDIILANQLAYGQVGNHRFLCCILHIQPAELLKCVSMLAVLQLVANHSNP